VSQNPIEQKSRHLTMVIPEQPSKPLTADDRRVIARGGRRGRPLDQPVAESLMIPFSIIVLDVLADDFPEVRLAERESPWPGTLVGPISQTFRHEHSTEPN
jgi:hypothetical protein